MAAPSVRLPAFCLVARLSDAPDFPAALGVAFQSLVSFMNTDRAREGAASFLLDVVPHEGVAVRTARLVPRAGEPAEALGTDGNWSPSMAVVDDWVLVGSATEQVQRLITALHAGAPPAVRTGTLGFDLDVPAALALARENRAALVANAILEEGKDPETAARDLDALLSVADLLLRAEAAVTRAEDALLLELRLRFTERVP